MKVRQRISTRIGEYKMPPLSIEELDAMLETGKAHNGRGALSGVVEAKLREGVWSIPELIKELDLANKKQVANAFYDIRGRGVKIERYNIHNDEGFVKMFTVRGGGDGSSA